MKNSATLLLTALFVLLTVFASLSARAEEVDENANLKELVGKLEKLDSEGFQLPNTNNVRTKSNPKLRPVEVIQPNEYVELEAAGQIPSPYIKNGVTQGWLVNPCIVVAPRHAIIGNGNVDKNLTNIEVDFKVGYQGKNSFKQIVKISPISCGRGNDGEDMGGEDFCIYKANRSLKGLVKPIKIGSLNLQRYDVVPEISVGFFPQASGQLDVLAKDKNSKIVDGDSTYLETRAAVNSGAGLIDIDTVTHEKKLIGMHVGPFNAVNSKRILEKIEKIRAKDANVFKCN